MLRYLTTVVFVSIAIAQSQFVSLVGGTESDIGGGVVQTSDGGYIVSGLTCSFGAGSDEMIICRFDSIGNPLWKRTLGGGGGDYSFSLILAPGDGVVVAGTIVGFGPGGSDIALCRFDASGNHLWSKAIGGAGEDGAISMVRTSDGGFGITGNTKSFGGDESEIILCRLDSSGNHLWTTTVDVSVTDWDCGISLIQTSDGGFAVTGYTDGLGAGSEDIILSRFDASGNHLWTKTLGGDSSEIGYSVVQTLDGGFAVAGHTNSFGAGDYDIIVCRLDSLGNHLWTKTLGGTDHDGGSDLTLVSMATDPFGNLLVAGMSMSYTVPGTLLVRLDSSGNILGARVAFFGMSSGLALTGDGGLVTTGTYYLVTPGDYDLALMKFDSAGTTCIGIPVTPTVTSPSPTITSPTPTITSPTPTVMAISPTVTIPTTKDTMICPIGIEEVSGSPSFYLRVSGSLIRFFLPAESYARLTVYDATGRLVARPVDGIVQAGEHEIDLGDHAGSPLQKGVYLVQLDVGAQHAAPTLTKLVIR